MITFVLALISLSYRFLKQGCRLSAAEVVVLASPLITVGTIATVRFREQEAVRF